MIPLVNVADHSEAVEATVEPTRSGVSSESPGAGAFTVYTGRRFEARKPIPAFAELYVSVISSVRDPR
jgi:hypothetical protein